MSLDVPLQVAIALAFIYALTSLLASAVQELIASCAKLRARNLAEGLRQILQNDAPADGDVKRRSLFGRTTVTGSTLFGSVLSHPLVHGGSTGKLPSYASSHNLALALLDRLKGTSPDLVFTDIRAQVALLPDGAAKTSLLALLADARNDVDLLQKRLETWFDDAMERMSGAYKRWTQVTTLVIGLVTAVVLNIDTIHIVQTLWSDPGQRNAATATVEAYLREHPLSTIKPQNVSATRPGTPAGAKPNDASSGTPPADPQPAAPPADDLTGAEVKRVIAQLTDLPLPIGAPWPNAALGWPIAILGWLLTAVAVSLGAPFWFDTLQRLANLRGAGAKPKRADER